MSKEREFLKKLRYATHLENDLRKELEELLAQPEQENIYQKLLRIEERLDIEILPSHLWLDGYETAIRNMQSEQEPAAWMYKRIPISTGVITRGVTDYIHVGKDKPLFDDSFKATDLTPLYLAPPKREPLSDKEITKNTPKLIHIGERLAFHAGVRFAEKAHGIGGGE